MSLPAIAGQPPQQAQPQVQPPPLPPPLPPQQPTPHSKSQRQPQLQPQPQSHSQSHSQPQPQPQMHARPRPQSGLQDDVAQPLALPASSGKSATSRRVITSGRPKLVRRDYAVDLTAARLHFGYARLSQHMKAGKMLDIATPRAMESLIRWLESGVVPRSLHLECDLGGPRCYEDPEYDNREVLDGQLFKRLLQACRGIRKLVFEECRLSEDNFRMLGAFLMQEGCKLEALALIDHEIDDQCAGHLAKALRSNSSLRELSLRGGFSRVSTTAMAKIIDAVARTPSIIVLQLEYNRDCMIWPSQLESVLASGSRVQLVLSKPSPVWLDLWDRRHWDGAFAEFCERLGKDTALRLLDLSGYDLTQANIGVLLAALQRNAHLERLELGRIALTCAQQALIKRCLEQNEANNQVQRQVAEWQAAKALDRLVPALLATCAVWPHELSQLLAMMMDAETLEAIKKSGGARIASGKQAKGQRVKSSRE